jgi:hypothetical protein
MKLFQRSQDRTVGEDNGDGSSGRTKLQDRDDRLART